MVQGISANINNYAELSRVRNTTDGRVIYEVSDPSGKYPSARLSVPETQSDVFERSYSDLIKAAPKMEKYAQELSTPEKQERNRKINKWSKIIGGAVGLGVSAVLTKKMDKFILQALICVPSTIAGFIGGAYAGARMTMPKEALSFTKTMQNISKLDIQPVE